jgi:hypothetical protein
MLVCGGVVLKEQTGNPGGQPKGAIEVRDLARKHTVAAINRLFAIMQKGSLWLDTLPKVASLCFEAGVRIVDHRADGFVEVKPSGAQIWIAGLDEKERRPRARGLGGNLRHRLEINHQYSLPVACIRLTRLDKLTVPSRLPQPYPAFSG